jgi:hypothetical protein
MAPDEVLGSREVLGVVAIDGRSCARRAMDPRNSNEGVVASGGNALPQDDPGF